MVQKNELFVTETRPPKYHFSEVDLLEIWRQHSDNIPTKCLQFITIDHDMKIKLSAEYLQFVTRSRSDRHVHMTVQSIGPCHVIPPEKRQSSVSGRAAPSGDSSQTRESMWSSIFSEKNCDFFYLYNNRISIWPVTAISVHTLDGVSHFRILLSSAAL